MNISAINFQNKISFHGNEEKACRKKGKDYAKYVIPALLMFNVSQMQGVCPKDSIQLKNDSLLTVPVDSTNQLASALGLTYLDDDIKKAIDGKTIVLDPGHGGTYKTMTSKSDPYGAKYYDYKEKKWHYEKDINLESAKKITKHLERFGAKVVLTRDSDEYLTLERRAELAKENNADLFVSIHVNGNTTKSVRGLEVHSLPSANKGTKDSKDFAKLLNSRFSDLFEGSKSKLKENDYNVLKFTKDIPGALLELGYLTNPKDRDYLLNEDYKNSAAERTAASVLEFFVKKQQPSEASFLAKSEN